jgi:hypothetical protein
VPTNLSDAAASAAAKAVTDLADAGTGAAHGSLAIYSGTEPASASSALSGNTLLASLPLSNPAFTTGATGARNAGAITTAAAVATGTATFCRFLDRDGNAVFQGTVGTSGADLNLGSTSLQSGASVSVTSFTYTQPE